MKTDTSEKGIKTLIIRYITGTDGHASGASGFVAKAAPKTGSGGWFAGNAAVYDREFTVDVERSFAFLTKTQPEQTTKLGIVDYKGTQWQTPTFWKSMLSSHLWQLDSLGQAKSGCLRFLLRFLRC